MQKVERGMILVIVGLLAASCTSTVPTMTPAVPATTPTMPLITVETKAPSLLQDWSQSDMPLPTPVPSFTPTFVPTMTSTPQPPLVAHEWYPRNVLVLSWESSGYVEGGGYNVASFPPSFVLFYDGRLYITDFETEEGNYRRRIQFVQLKRQQICALLNTIDQTGFFDYDTSSYKPPSTARGGPSTNIHVNAWQRKGGNFDDLFYYLSYELTGEYLPGAPEITPALRNTYFLLSGYKPAGLVEYQPERVAVWVYENVSNKNDLESFASAWPLSMPRLADIYSQTKPPDNAPMGRYIIYQGDLAGKFYELVRNLNTTGIYTEGDHQYSVYVQILLPSEFPVEGLIYSFTVEPGPQVTIQCVPDDGLVPIPIPTP